MKRYLISLIIQLNLLITVLSQSLANSFFAEDGTYPGFVTRINRKAFDLAAEHLKDRVARFMQIDGLSFNISAPLTNEVQFSLSSNRLLAFDEANFISRMVIIPTKGLAWTGSNLNVTALAAFRMHTPQGDITGTVPLSFDRTNVELLLWTGINADGHLKTDLVTCKVAANNMQLRFAPADQALLANYLPHIHNFIRQTIEQVICPSFHAELVPVISNRIMNTPLSAALFEQYFINYALLGGVDFSEEAVVLRHRGNSFGILRQGRTRLNDFRLPFRSPALDASPNLTATEHMLDFYLSNYTMASLLFWMDQYKSFDYEISRTAQNNTQLQGYLKTECAPGDICAGTLFPALAVRFPNGEVIIKSHTTTYPRMLIEKDNATIYIDSRVDAFVQQGERTRRFLTASMNADVKLDKIHFTNYVLHADMHIEKFKISEVASLVDGIDEGSLEFLVNALTELILNEDMSKKLRGGIHLPIMFDYDQHSSEVAFEEGRIRISTNFCFGEKCKAPVPISEQKDSNTDYYDTVG